MPTDKPVYSYKIAADVPFVDDARALGACRAINVAHGFAQGYVPAGSEASSALQAAHHRLYASQRQTVIVDVYSDGRLTIRGAAVEATAPNQRPTGMAELAQAVAKELRKCRPALHAAVLFAEEPHTIYVPRPTKKVLQRQDAWRFPQLYWAPYRITDSDFDNLTPLEIASLIQSEEAKRAAEWAGDT